MKYKIFLIITFCWGSNLLAQEPADPAGECKAYLYIAKNATIAVEREYALAALSECPASSEATRVLETAIRGDDAGSRRAAFESLGRHLDAMSPTFLAELYHNADGGLIRSEVERYYEYLAAVATPAYAGELAPILIRGLHHPAVAVRRHALIGLGRLEQQDHWPHVRAALDRDPATTAAALTAARRIGHPDSLTYALRYLNDKRTQPPEEAAAVELLAKLGGPTARESLMIHSLRRPDGENAELIRRRIAELHDPKIIVAYTDKAAALHAEPTERARIKGVVERYTILYIEEATGKEYRMQTERGETAASNWLWVRTTSGLTGWVHEAGVRRYPVGKMDGTPETQNKAGSEGM